MDNRGGGEYQDFSSKFLCPLFPRIFVEESFTVALISVFRKGLDKKVGSFKVFRRKFFVSQCRKNS